jgi:tetratricopeptide (TPR) repeat protein
MTFSRIIFIVFIGMMSGCAPFQKSQRLDYRTIEASPLHDQATAIKKHDAALKSIEKCEASKAEKFLQESLIADVSYGPAHNTLGKIYFDQGKLYLAAWEFEYAADSMPQRGEPHNNLGLVYEAAGQFNVAVDAYEESVAIAPDNPEFLGNLLRAKVRRGDDPLTLLAEFEQLVFLDTRPTWKHWAEQQIALTKIPSAEPVESNAKPNSNPASAPPLDPPKSMIPTVPSTLMESIPLGTATETRNRPN